MSLIDWAVAKYVVSKVIESGPGDAFASSNACRNESEPASASFNTAKVAGAVRSSNARQRNRRENCAAERGIEFHIRPQTARLIMAVASLRNSRIIFYGRAG